MIYKAEEFPLEKQNFHTYTFPFLPTLHKNKIEV